MLGAKVKGLKSLCRNLCRPYGLGHISHFTQR